MRPFTARPTPSVTSAGEAGGLDFYALGSHAHPVPQCPWWPIEDNASGVSISAALSSTTQMYVYPLFLPGPLKLAKAYMSVTGGAAGQTLKVALYDADGQRVVDAWTFDVSSAGRKTNTFATVRELAVGFYYYGFTVNQTGVTWQCRGIAAGTVIHPGIGYIAIASANTPPEAFDPRAVITLEPGHRPFVTLSAY